MTIVLSDGTEVPSGSADVGIFEGQSSIHVRVNGGDEDFGGWQMVGTVDREMLGREGDVELAIVSALPELGEAYVWWKEDIHGIVTDRASTGRVVLRFDHAAPRLSGVADVEPELSATFEGEFFGCAEGEEEGSLCEEFPQWAWNQSSYDDLIRDPSAW